MYAVEFETVSKDGVIYIPQEYRDELGNRDDIRLIVMYDIATQIGKNRDEPIDKLKYLVKLFLITNNQITATKELAINPDKMTDDIS